MTNITVVTENNIIDVSVVQNNVTVTPFVSTVVQAFPAGLKGDSGSSASAISTVSPTSFSGHIVIACLASGLTIADSSNVTHLGRVIGITSSSVSTGGNINIVTSGGIIDGFTGLVTGSTYYFNTLGIPTLNVPTVGFIQQLGVAISDTELAINLSIPIILG
jgi:hypothetical protein